MVHALSFRHRSVPVLSADLPVPTCGLSGPPRGGDGPREPRALLRLPLPPPLRPDVAPRPPSQRETYTPNNGSGRLRASPVCNGKNRNKTSQHKVTIWRRDRHRRREDKKDGFCPKSLFILLGSRRSQPFDKKTMHKERLSKIRKSIFK